MTNPKDIEKDMRYLQLLSNSFPTIADASTEIINLQAILNLPKGTEHFLADIHGEYEAFQHVLKNASGNIKRKVNDLFGTTLREAEKRELCTLIYYPEQKLELVHERTEDTNKTAYVNEIIDTIISTGRADDFIIAMAGVIQRLAIDQLHLLGDIYDRGPGAHRIMDLMENYEHWDITWGNHDIMWMGAAAGNDALVATLF